MTRRRTSVNIYDYPEHLNPFREEVDDRSDKFNTVGRRRPSFRANPWTLFSSDKGKSKTSEDAQVVGSSAASRFITWTPKLLRKASFHRTPPHEPFRASTLRASLPPPSSRSSLSPGDTRRTLSPPARPAPPALSPSLPRSSTPHAHPAFVVVGGPAQELPASAGEQCDQEGKSSQKGARPKKKRRAPPPPGSQQESLTTNGAEETHPQTGTQDEADAQIGTQDHQSDVCTAEAVRNGEPGSCETNAPNHIADEHDVCNWNLKIVESHEALDECEDCTTLHSGRESPSPETALRNGMGNVALTSEVGPEPKPRTILPNMAKD